MCDFYIQSAESSTTTDIEGSQYIDLAVGIAMLNTEHHHSRLVQIVEAQLQAFTRTAYRIAPYESCVSLAERINVVTPINGKHKTTLFTTGAETVESAAKVARVYTDRPGVIIFDGGSRGRIYMAMALTGKVVPHKKGLNLSPGSIYHVPHPSEL